MDWDLQAIVVCTREAPATIMDNTHRILSQYFCSEQEHQLCNFQEFSETASVVDELEELYKPFYPPILNNPLPIVTNSPPIPEEVKVLKPSNQVAVQDLQDPVTYKCKKSKKKEKNKRVKRVVTTADGVSDPWAWRKYGQKPIKGSPYPRSYYRCSSSKGCLARKQVEQSHLDPGIFLVTYTAEHSDPHPPRNNSRARNNSSTTAPPSVKCEQSKGLKIEDNFLEGDGWFPSIYRA